jgi:hypothetical protein
MKSTFLNIVCLSLALSFAAACGKKESSGSKGPNYTNLNQFTGTQAGDAAYNSLKNWQASSSEASTVGIHGIFLKKTPSGFIKSMCQKYMDVIPCDAPTACFKHTSNGLFKGTVIMTSRTNFLGIKIDNYSDCDITTNMSLYQKQSNTELSEAVLGNSTKFVIPSLTQQSNSIFKVYFGSFSGSTAPTSYTVINTSLPSIMNPVEVGTVVNGQQTPSLKVLEYLTVQ